MSAGRSLLRSYCRRLSRARRRRSAALHPLADALWTGGRAHARGGRRQPAPRLVLAQEGASRPLDRRNHHVHLGHPSLHGGSWRSLLGRRGADDPGRYRLAVLLWPLGAGSDPAAVLRLLPHLFGPLAFMGISQMRAYDQATPTGASSSTMFAARPRRRKRFAASSTCGSRERRSSVRAASASAACSS